MNVETSDEARQIAPNVIPFGALIGMRMTPLVSEIGTPNHEAISEPEFSPINISGISEISDSTSSEKIQIDEDGILYGVDVRMGHKTGFYVDQRDNRRLARQLAETFRKVHGRGMRALNCFCYTGGFSLALAKGGAEEVISIDSSADALEMAKSNAKLNEFNESQMKWVEANVFEQLRKYRDAGEKFDLVILDPPKFASSHHHVEKAARAYKDINLNGLRLLNEGGQLLTFSCSGAIDVDLFQKIVAGAVIDAKTDAWMISRLGAGSDHPLLMTHPEGEYLKGLHLVSRGANTAG